MRTRAWTGSARDDEFETDRLKRAMSAWSAPWISSRLSWSRWERRWASGSMVSLSSKSTALRKSVAARTTLPQAFSLASTAPASACVRGRWRAAAKSRTMACAVWTTLVM